MHRFAKLRNVTKAITPFGWTVFVMVVLAWFAGAQLGWKEMMVVAATGLVLFGLAGLLTIGNLDLSSTLKVEPARVVVGERAAGSMIMRNRSNRRSRVVRVELPVGKSAATFEVPHLAPDAEYDELFVVPTNRRAVIPVGPVTTVQGDPLGIVRRLRTWSEQYEIFVHPQTVILETLSAGLIRDIEGQTTNQLTNSDIAFHTMRDYVPGDDRRHVHWKSSAKLDRLMVRQYVDTRRSHIGVLLSLDANEYASADEFELAVSCAASVAMQAIRDEQTLTVILGATQIPTVNPKDILDHFTRLETIAGTGGINECFATARRVANEASVTTAAVGSIPSVADIRRAASRASSETKVIVVQCDLDRANGYRSIGSTSFVQLNQLAQLRRGVMAVM